MCEPVKSFHFHADGTRAARGEPPQPEAFALAALALLYEEVKSGEWLPGALVRMREFDHPGLLQNPRGFILKGGGDGVEVLEPYSHFRDGARCVLADPGSHMEWKKRAGNAYETREKLPSDEELRSYAETGNMPREDLAAFALAPSPPTVLFDFSMDTTPLQTVTCKDSMMRKMYEAHCQHKIEIKGVFAKYLKKPGKPRNRMPLCKGPADDKGGARGYVEDALRTRFMIEDNTFPLNRCSFEVRKQAYMANRKRILEYKSREAGRAVQDNRENWTTKVRWARDYQKSCGRISLTPPKTSKKKKRKRGKSEPHPPPIQYNMFRGGAAKASQEGLQIPQIMWGEQDFSNWYFINYGTRLTRFDVLVVSAETFAKQYFRMCAADPYVALPFKEEENINVIVVGNPYDHIESQDLDYFRHYIRENRARVVSKPVEIENLHLLLQWLPLWWDYPKHVAPERALLPNLRSKLDAFLLTAPRGPMAREDGKDEGDSRMLWVRQLIHGAGHLPLFATACGLEDCKPVQINS